jgi:WD40 repeat protein
VRRLEAHTGTVRTIVFSPEGSSWDPAATMAPPLCGIWVPAGVASLRRAQGSVDTVAFSPDSRLFAAGSGWGRLCGKRPPAKCSRL